MHPYGQPEPSPRPRPVSAHLQIARQRSPMREERGSPPPSVVLQLSDGNTTERVDAAFGNDFLGCSLRILPTTGIPTPHDKIAILRLNVHLLSVHQAGRARNVHGHPKCKVLPPSTDS